MKSRWTSGLIALFFLAAAACDGSSRNGDETHFVGSGPRHRQEPTCAPGGCDAGTEADGAGAAVSSRKAGGPGGSPGVGVSAGGASASACSPLEKMCAGTCILRTPLIGCANPDCAPCASPPANGIVLCNIQGNCDFDCVSGYQPSGSDCVRQLDSGTGGAPTGNGTGGAANPPMIPASCSDLMMNGTESDTDCGGAVCPHCLPGHACRTAGDCTSSVCLRAACQQPTCSDGVRNGDETDTDCGGGTGGSNCPQCGPGLSCKINEDCMSAVCTAKVCQ